LNIEPKQRSGKNSTVPEGFETHGEKMYDVVFNQGINFWANLIISAGFTYWVNHSKAPIMKTPPTWAKWLGHAPIHAQSTVRNGIHDLPIMNLLGPKMAKEQITAMESLTNNVKVGSRMKVAKFMADAFTLTSVGTFIMIPGVWGAQKIKSDFVRWQDKMHYGDDAENIAWVQQAHDRIDHEKKPTMLGYMVGRIGSMAAVQATAYTVGHGDVFKWIGKNTPLKFLEKFEGIDHFAGNVGDALGGSFASMSKNASRSTNKLLTDNHIDWSLDQRRWAHKILNGHDDVKLHGLDADEVAALHKQATAIQDSSPHETNYNRAFQDFGKYVGLDTMYTAVTAGSIVPLIGWLKEHVPGMSYTVAPKHKEKPQARVERQSIRRDATIDQPEVQAIR
jgi:hypothetical protein